jgi:ribosomal-protein-alanine N-acetyltransferase
MTVNTIYTTRLRLRRVTLQDAPFILTLVNDPDWLTYIGDKNVNNLEGAENYIKYGPLAMYQQFGFGLMLVELKQGAEPIGSCGLLQRDYLDCPDIGFAFMPAFRGQGYAFEAALGIMDEAFPQQFAKIAGLTSLNNEASMGLLRKLGMHFERVIHIAGQQAPSNLFITGASDA